MNVVTIHVLYVISPLAAGLSVRTVDCASLGNWSEHSVSSDGRLLLGLQVVHNDLMWFLMLFVLLSCVLPIREPYHNRSRPFCMWPMQLNARLDTEPQTKQNYINACIKVKPGEVFESLFMKVRSSHLFEKEVHVYCGVHVTALAVDCGKTSHISQAHAQHVVAHCKPSASVCPVVGVVRQLKTWAERPSGGSASLSLREERVSASRRSTHWRDGRRSRMRSFGGLWSSFVDVYSSMAKACRALENLAANHNVRGAVKLSGIFCACPAPPPPCWNACWSNLPGRISLWKLFLKMKDNNFLSKIQNCANCQKISPL